MNEVELEVIRAAVEEEYAERVDDDPELHSMHTENELRLARQRRSVAVREFLEGRTG